MAPEKTEQPVIVYTRLHRIEGAVVLFKGERLGDKFNQTERQFESIEHARVYALTDDRLVHEAPSVAVNKNHVALVVPREET
ncbi:hypothetical protein JW916_09970 [Candidatus Sumerlaeota bacterium]|nr:hypothetical protein [Candidatus Sumerlaeota bacterium]